MKYSVNYQGLIIFKSLLSLFNLLIRYTEFAVGDIVLYHNGNPQINNTS